MKYNGFSLLELSIVLVIIGLIAGGIVAGSSMIRAAELRAIITEHQQYQTAVHSFRDKYLGLPGDLKNATAFWGAAHTTPATCLTAVGTGTQTCNGDGNGQIEQPAAASQYGESLTFWQHLANADIVSGNFSGIGGSGSAFDAELGVNAPESKLSGAGWAPRYYGTHAGDTYWFSGNYGNIFSFGSDVGVGWTWGRIITPSETWSIDKKIDDGRPGLGNVVAGWYTDCTDRTAGENTQADAQAAEYDLTSDDIACGVIFRKAF